MRRAAIIACALAVACAGPRVPQPEVPPPQPERLSTAQPVARTPTDEAATELFLDHEIERRRYVAPAPVPSRVVERVYVESPADGYRDHYRMEQEYYRSRFPWNAAVGAGLGAVIGHQSGHRDQGAAIGAGVGLLFDVMRWR